MLGIWGRESSINVQKVLWLCGELELAFERVDAGGAFGKLDTPDYLAHNPNGLIPTLFDGDIVLWESNAILRYLAARYASGPLWPNEPGGRANADKWMDWQLTTLWPEMRTVFIQLVRMPADKRDAAALKAAHGKSLSAWQIVERELDGNDYVAGGALSLADIALGVVAYRWFALDIERPPMPALEAWYKRLQARPPFLEHVMKPLG